MSQHLLAGERAAVCQIDQCGVDVIVEAPSGQHIAAKADIGEQEQEENLFTGGTTSTAIQTKSVDFIIPTKYLRDTSGDDFDVDGSWNVHFNGYSHRVQSLPGVPPVEEHGRFRLMKRIHTKEFGKSCITDPIVV